MAPMSNPPVPDDAVTAFEADRTLKALVIRGGKFGERWGKICQAYGVECTFIDVEWGKSVDPQVVKDALDKDAGIRAVYATASETSTGRLPTAPRTRRIAVQVPLSSQVAIAAALTSVSKPTGQENSRPSVPARSIMRQSGLGVRRM